MSDQSPKESGHVCLLCKSSRAVVLYEVRVNHVAMRASVYLCRRHGDALLIRYGAALGSLFAEHDGDAEAAGRFVEACGLDEPKRGAT